MRWLRTFYEVFPNACILRAVRSDGQVFAASYTGNIVPVDTLRNAIDAAIDDPSLPAGVGTGNRLDPDHFKGEPGWIEETV